MKIRHRKKIIYVSHHLNISPSFFPLRVQECSIAVCIENSHLLRVKSKLYLVIRNHTTILAGVPLWLLSYARVDIYVIILISKCEKTKWAIIKDGKAGSFRPAAVLSKKKK